MSSVAIIIVNYRTADLVVDCLRALRGGRSHRIIVADNASGDGSVERLRSATAAEDLSGEVLALETNGGFAAGNNAALRHLHATGNRPDYVLLLNPDTVPRAGAVEVLADFLDAHPRAGIAGSRLEFEDGAAQTSAFRFPTVAGELEHGARFGPLSRLLARRCISMPIAERAHPADWVTGASMMIRAEVIDEIGFLDEDYFLYYEEVDYCRRAAAAGWQCWFVPESRVVHLVSRSTGIDDPLQPRRTPDYWFASRQRYYAKHHRPLDALCASLAWATGFALWRIKRRLTRQTDPDPPRLLHDFVRHTLIAPLVGPGRPA